MKYGVCKTCGQRVPEITFERKKVLLNCKVVEKVHADRRKKTWIARETGLPIRVVSGIKSMPLKAAIERYCQ